MHVCACACVLQHAAKERERASEMHEEATISDDGDSDIADELPLPSVSQLGALPVEQVRGNSCAAPCTAICTALCVHSSWPAGMPHACPLHRG